MKFRIAFGLLLGLIAPSAASAQNQDQPFQDFFSTVCAGTPSGNLATRCGETPSGAGDLSGDSEVSLNPNQALAGHDSARSRARELSQEIEERLALRRSEPEEDTLPPFGLIFNARGTFVDRDRSTASTMVQATPLQRERGYDGTEWSLQLGGDTRIGNSATLGLLFSYAGTDLEFSRDNASNASFAPPSQSGNHEADSYFFTLFGSLDLTDAAYLDASIGAGWTDYNLQRRVVFQESTQVVPQTLVLTRADPTGWELSVTGGGGYDFAFRGVSLGPYARVRYVRTAVESYSERDRSSSGLAMRIGDDTRHSIVSVLGARASYAISLPFGVLLPGIRAEWEHEYEDERLSTTQRFRQDSAGNNYNLEGDRPDVDYANVGGGLVLVLPRGVMLFADYEALLGYTDLVRHRVTGGLRIELP